MNALAFALSVIVVVSCHPKVQAGACMGEPLELGGRVGPLILTAIEAGHLWIAVAWDPKTPPSGRHISGKVPAETVSAASLQIQLDQIEPRSSGDPAQEAEFKRTFIRGVEKLLEGPRPFWFHVTNDVYAGPGQIGGVFSLDGFFGSTLQSEMVRCGYAVVSRKHWQSIGSYTDTYRQRLLQLENEAHTYQLGIWSRQ